MRRYLLAALLLFDVFALVYAAGQLARPAPAPSVELRWSADRRWVEVYADGEIIGEYCERRDGALFRGMAEALALRD